LESNQGAPFNFMQVVISSNERINYIFRLNGMPAVCFPIRCKEARVGRWELLHHRLFERIELLLSQIFIRIAESTESSEEALTGDRFLTLGKFDRSLICQLRIDRPGQTNTFKHIAVQNEVRLFEVSLTVFLPQVQDERMTDAWI